MGILIEYFKSIFPRLISIQVNLMEDFIINHLNLDSHTSMGQFDKSLLQATLQESLITPQ